MRRFDVYSHPTRGHKAVKQGFSWPGFFLGPIWAYAKQLPVHGTVLLLLHWIAIAIAAAGGLLVLAADVGSPIVIGLMGNRWRRERLRKLGYQLAGTVEAETADGAVAKAIGPKARDALAGIPGDRVSGGTDAGSPSDPQPYSGHAEAAHDTTATRRAMVGVGAYLTVVLVLAIGTGFPLSRGRAVPEASRGMQRSFPPMGEVSSSGALRMQAVPPEATHETQPPEQPRLVAAATAEWEKSESTRRPPQPAAQKQGKDAPAPETRAKCKRMVADYAEVIAARTDDSGVKLGRARDSGVTCLRRNFNDACFRLWETLAAMAAKHDETSPPERRRLTEYETQCLGR